MTGREVSADPAPLLRLVYLRLAGGAFKGPGVEAVAPTGTFDCSILIGGGRGLVLVDWFASDGPATGSEGGTCCEGPAEGVSA